MLAKILLSLLISPLAAQAAITYVYEPFTGIDDFGTEVACAPSNYVQDCRFQMGATNFQGFNGHGSRVYNCAIAANGVPARCEGLNDGATISVYLKTKVVGTGLVICRFQIGKTGGIDCAEHYNAEAGIFGIDRFRKTVAKCRDNTGRLIMLDMATEKPTWNCSAGDGSCSYGRGDLGIQVHEFPRRNYVFGSPIYAKKEDGVIKFIDHNFSAYKGEPVAELPLDFAPGKKVRGKITAHDINNYRTVPRSEMVDMECDISESLPEFKDVYPRAWPILQLGGRP